MASGPPARRIVPDIVRSWTSPLSRAQGRRPAYEARPWMALLGTRASKAPPRARRAPRRGRVTRGSTARSAAARPQPRISPTARRSRRSDHPIGRRSMAGRMVDRDRRGTAGGRIRGAGSGIRSRPPRGGSPWARPRGAVLPAGASIAFLARPLQRDPFSSRPTRRRRSSGTGVLEASAPPAVLPPTVVRLIMRSHRGTGSARAGPPAPCRTGRPVSSCAGAGSSR